MRTLAGERAPIRGGKEVAIVEMLKAALAEGKKAVMVTVTAASRARLIWTYKLPKESVICSAKASSHDH